MVEFENYIESEEECLELLTQAAITHPYSFSHFKYGCCQLKKVFTPPYSIKVQIKLLCDLSLYGISVETAVLTISRTIENLNQLNKDAHKVKIK